MSKRLPEFDTLRVIATFAVIGIHITAGYAAITSLAYVLNQLVRFAVPTFIIISGFLLYYIYSPTRPMSTGNFYCKRIKRVLLPYINWSFIYFIITLVVSAQYTGILNTAVQFLSKLVCGTAWYHLYFVVIIFQLYLLYPWLRNLMKQQPLALLIFTFILTLISQTILYLNMMHKIVLPPQYQSFYLVFFPVWIFYFVLGMYLAQNPEKIKALVINHTVGITLMWIASLMLLFLDSYVTATHDSSIRPSVMLYTVCTYFWLYSLALKLKYNFSSTMSWLSNQSFLIFLMHPFFLTVLLYAAHYIMPSLWNGNVGMLGLYLATTALTIGATWIISYTPLTAWLGGVRRTNNNLVK